MTRHEAIENEAIEWLIRRDEPDWAKHDQAELDAWLEESMANRAAYLRASHGWEEASRIRSIGAWESRDHARSRPRLWWPAAIAASVAVLIGVGFSSTPQIAKQSSGRPLEVQATRFDTAVGGRKIVTFADGSRVELNTRSTIRAAVGRAGRDVWLETGEAYFEVAHSKGNLFVVHAGRQKITVLGTKFSVRRDNDRVTVNVVEGRVRVDNGQRRDTSAAIITAGDTAIARESSTLIAASSKERVESALAWRVGMLNFDLRPLSEVATEFNRYNQTQLAVDPSVATIPIGGTFQASNVDAFARLLHDAYGLKTERDGENIRISN